MESIVEFLISIVFLFALLLGIISIGFKKGEI
jgi:hypothetical protein